MAYQFPRLNLHPRRRRCSRRCGRDVETSGSEVVASLVVGSCVVVALRSVVAAWVVGLLVPGLLWPMTALV